MLSILAKLLEMGRDPSMRDEKIRITKQLGGTLVKVFDTEASSESIAIAGRHAILLMRAGVRPSLDGFDAVGPVMRRAIRAAPVSLDLLRAMLQELGEQAANTEVARSS